LKGAGLSVLFYVILFLLGVFIIALKINPQSNTRFLKNIALSASVLLFLILVFSPKAQILPPSFTRFDREIIEYRETVEGTWVVGREPGGKGAALSTYVNNSAVIGSSYDAIKVVKMVGHLPFYAGLKCKNVLVVGFGIGVTTSAIASHPEVESIDCIELVAGLKDAAHYYSGLNNNIQTDRRLKVISGDGRSYLQATGKKYDLISSDPTHPILGSGSLYTKEYFELCKLRLKPGGMVSQYLPLHKLLPADFQGIIKTFHAVFPNSTVWLGHNHAVLLGINGQLKIDFGQWSDNISSSVKDSYFYNNPYHLAACLVLDSAAIGQFSPDIKLNTDNRPLTEFFRLSSFDAKNLTTNLDFLNKSRTDVNNVFVNIPDQPMMNRFIAGNKLLTDGLYDDLQGNRQAFFDKLQAAVAANPENEEYPFLIKFNFGR
jgi:spermidine synthase